MKLSKERTAVGCKWIFKVNYNRESKVEQFKNIYKLVAKGYIQGHGIDFKEPFSAVIRFSSI